MTHKFDVSDRPIDAGFERVERRLNPRISLLRAEMLPLKPGEG